jgi:signal transduction histidine kinase
MGESYLASLLLTGGVCLGFAMHALMLARHLRQRAYVCLTLLSLFEAVYCVCAYGFYREIRPAMALRWARAFCVFMPFMTPIFAELVMDLVGRGRVRPRWFRLYQRANLVATSAFSIQVILDGLFDSAVVLGSGLTTDLASRHRHTFPFTTLGHVWLAWVSLNFVVFALVLARASRTRRQLVPIVVGSATYFAVTISDFGVATGLYDSYYLQHLGFSVLVAAFWGVLARRYELSLLELSAVVGTLEKQRRRLAISPQLAHQNRLDGVGLLAAGVAHEINNPVQGIMNYAELLKKQTIDGQALEFANEIVQECRQVAAIVKALLSFSRSDDKQLGSVSAREMIEDVVRLMRSSMTAAGIRVKVDVAVDAPEIQVGAQRLKQVIMNLLTNATDALADRDPGRRGDKLVRIVASREAHRGGTWLVIDAIDNADGIEPAIIERIFDPFFTTKPPGQGTGLGLAISQEIVAACGGQLTCRSSRGEGTTFRVEVPAADASSPSPIA